MHVDARSPSQDPSQAEEECVTEVGHIQPTLSNFGLVMVVDRQDVLVGNLP